MMHSRESHTQSHPSHHSRRPRRGHRRIHRRDAVLAGITAAVLAAGLIAAALFLGRWEENRYAVSSGYTVAETEDSGGSPESVSSGDSAVSLKEVNRDGVTWREREGLSTYLFIGVDEEGEAVGTQSYIGGGQGDVQIVLVLDEVNETWQVLHINRDSMVEMDVLGVMGNVVASEFQQLALAHSYGDGLEESCDNNVRAVSDLLNGQTIDGYIALNMEGVVVLTDLVGGVTLTVTSDFSAVDESLTLGETITLTGEQALTYIRTRRDVDDETNLARMERQQQFLTALQEALSGEDAELAIRAYDALDDYMVTDIGSGTLQEIGEKLKTWTALETLTIDGENLVDEDGSWAYYLDENSLWDVILELFYEEAAEPED